MGSTLVARLEAAVVKTPCRCPRPARARARLQPILWQVQTVRVHVGGCARARRTFLSNTRLFQTVEMYKDSARMCVHHVGPERGFAGWKYAERTASHVALNQAQMVKAICLRIKLFSDPTESFSTFRSEMLVSFEKETLACVS